MIKLNVHPKRQTKSLLSFIMLPQLFCCLMSPALYFKSILNLTFILPSNRTFSTLHLRVVLQLAQGRLTTARLQFPHNLHFRELIEVCVRLPVRGISSRNLRLAYLEYFGYFLSRVDWPEGRTLKQYTDNGSSN